MHTNSFLLFLLLLWELCCTIQLLWIYYPSIRTFAATYLGHGGNSLNRAQNLPLPTIFSSSSGGHQGVQKPARRCNCSSLTWACSQASSWWDMPSKSHLGCAQEASWLDAWNGSFPFRIWGLTNRSAPVLWHISSQGAEKLEPQKLEHTLRYPLLKRVS